MAELNLFYITVLLQGRCSVCVRGCYITYLFFTPFFCFAFGSDNFILPIGISRISRRIDPFLNPGLYILMSYILYVSATVSKGRFLVEQETTTTVSSCQLITWRVDQGCWLTGNRPFPWFIFIYAQGKKVHVYP